MTEAEPTTELELPPLVTMGDPRLARPSAPVEPRLMGEPFFRERLEALEACMFANLGIGIAAPQIGWFERVFLMTVQLPPESDPEAELELLAWINPEIVWTSEEQGWAWEGCLSVPAVRGWIRRPLAVTARGLDARGDPISHEFTGWNARVFQHEFDHLEGMLFPYRALDPRHIVSLEALEEREDWPPDWPAPGARDAPLGEVVPDGG
jgi:peptide deformylase